MRFLFPYLAALLALVVLDGVWLGFVTRGFVQSQIGHLFGDNVIWWAAALFYVLYAAAVVYFASSSSSSIAEALMRGAILGFVAYMTYDLTNLATLRDWPVIFVLEDIAWGTVATAIAALAAYLVF